MEKQKKKTLEGEFISECLKVITDKIKEPKYKKLRSKVSFLYKQVGISLFATALMTSTIMEMYEKENKGKKKK